MRDRPKGKVLNMLICLFLPALICLGTVQSSFFFDIPERGEYRMLAEENYQDYLKKRDAAANPRCDSTISLEGFDSVSVTQEGNKKKFSIGADKNAPPIQKILDLCFNGVQMNEMFDGDMLKFVSGELDTGSQEVEFELTADKIALFDKIEVSRDLKIKMSWTEDGSEDRLLVKKSKIEITGNVDINHDLYNFACKKDKGTEKFLISKFDSKSNTPQLNIVGMLNGIDIDVDQTSFAKDSQDINLDKWADVQWATGCTGFGYFYKDNRFQIVWKSNDDVVDVEPFGDISSSQFVILKGTRSGDLSAAFGAIFSGDDAVGDIVNEIMTSDTKSFRTMMGRLDGSNCCYLMTKDPMYLSITNQKDRYKGVFGDCFDDDFKKSDRLKIYAGAQVKLQSEFKKTVSDCVEKMPSTEPKPDTSDLPDTITITCVKKQIGWETKFPKGTDIPIKAYTVLMGCKSGIDALYGMKPTGLGASAQITEMYMGMSDSSPVMSIAAKIAPTNPYVPGTNLKFEGVELKYDLEGGESTLAIESAVVSQKSDFATLCRCQNEDNEFKNFRCEIAVPSLTFGDLAKEMFDMKEPEEGVVNRDIILKTGVKDLKLIFYMGETNYCRVRGEFQFLTIDGVIVEMINVKRGGYAYGLYLTNINLESVIKSLTAFDYAVSLPWLTRMEGQLVWSNFQGKKEEEEEEEGDGEEGGDDGGDNSRMRRSVSTAVNTVTSKNKFVNAKYRSLKKAKANKRQRLVKSRARHHKRTSKRSGGGRSSGTATFTEVDTSEIEFETPSFKGYGIAPGVSCALVWKTPKKKEDCKKSAICEFLFDKLGSAQLSISGTFNDDKTLSLAAELSSTIQITDKLSFESATLEIEWGPSVDDRSVTISCELVYTDHDSFKDPLHFIGSIKISMAGSLSLEFGMKGMINEPFGTKNFAIGNIALGVDISKSETGLTMTLVIGCEIYLGDVANTPRKDFDERILSLKGYFGLNPKDPWESWLYAQANKLTLGKCGTIFGFKDKIPERFQEDGFSEGFTFSLAKSAQSIDTIGVDVEEGIYFKGAFKFWDFQGSAYLNLKPLSMTYEVDIQLCVIKWFNGFLEVTRMDDETKGPYLKLEMEPGAFSADINGKLKVLGLTYGAKIQIGGSKIYCKVIGSIFPGLFNGYVEIKGNFGVGSDFAGGSVMVGFQTSDLFDKLKKALMDFLGGAQEQAKSTCDEADGVIGEAEKQKSDSENETAKLKASIGGWKEKLRKRNEELKRKQKSSQSVQECKDKCEKVCFPFFTWISHCKQIWGAWIGCPGWDKCYKMIDNIICLGGCVVKAVANAFMTWVEETLNKIAIAMASVAESLTNVVQGVIDAAKKVGELAAKLKDAFMAGLRAIASLVLSAMNFKIRALELKAALKPDLDLCLSVGIDVSFFGFDYKSMHEHELCLSSILQSIINMITGNAPKTKDIGKMDETIEAVKGQQEGIKSASTDLADTKKETEEEVDTKTAEKFDEELEQKSKLPRPEMFEFIDRLKKKYNYTFTDEHRKYLHKPHAMPTYNIHDQQLANAVKTNAPWVHSANYDPLNYNFQPIQDDSESNINKRSYIFGESLTPCGRVKRSLGQYSDVTNQIMKGVTSMNGVKTQVNIAKRDHINKLANLYEQTHQLGSKYDDITEEQRSDIYHWYHTIRDGYMSHLANTKRHLVQHSYHALPILRSQIDHALKKNFNSSFEDFIDEIHGNAVASYKRSVIPTPEHVKGEEMLHNIKNDLVSIVTSENSPITSYESKLNQVNANIREMSKYAAKCQDA